MACHWRNRVVSIALTHIGGLFIQMFRENALIDANRRRWVAHLLIRGKPNNL